MLKPVMTFAFIALYGLAVVIPIKNNQIEMGGMNMEYKIERNEILVTLFAPTKGWLAVGFNDENNIEKSDLRMFSVQNGEVIGEDRYVRGFRDYPIDEAQGGTQDMEIIEGHETKKGTTITFKMPLQSTDEKDFQHKLDESYWLILAYSSSDDFQHHSIMRKHRKVSLQ